MQKTTDTVVVIFVFATAVRLIRGLIVIPALEEAEASHTTRNKGRQGEFASGGNRQGTTKHCTLC